VATVLRTFAYPVGDIPFDVAIDRRTQLDRNKQPYVAPPECDCNPILDERVFPPSLVNAAIDSGRLINRAIGDKRRLACLGFAFVELVQLLVT
jgi:hypothetical protein